MTANGDDSSKDAGKVPGKERLAAPLPKRFYKSVTVGEAASDAGAPGYQILLDGRVLRTPAKRTLLLPSRALADAMAEEWAAQGEHIDPATMPLTKLVMTAIDGVSQHMREVAADVVQFASSDLICYRADAPEGLVRLQNETWNPVLAWAEAALGARFRLAEGVMPVEQDREALDRVSAAVAPFNALMLTSLHVMTTLTGSALLALARASGKLTAEEVWSAAHIDEDWQIRQWGIDVEAAERRERRWTEMRAASRLLELAGTEPR